MLPGVLEEDDGADVVEETLAGGLDHVVHRGEAVGSARPRVGDLPIVRIVVAQRRIEVAQHHDARTKFGLRCPIDEVEPVRVVHGHDEVVEVGISRVEVAGPRGEFDPAPLRLGPGPRVGGPADMPGGGAGAVDLDAIAQTGLIDQRPHDALGGRGAADVAEADEADVQGFGHTHPVSLLRYAAGTGDPVAIRSGPEVSGGHVDDFAGRSGAVLVTGGSGGIGAAICRMFAERGSDVMFTFRKNRDAAAALEAEITAMGRRAASVSVDLADEAAALATVTATIEQFGGMHTLVHAAGPHVDQIHLSRVKPSQYRAQIEGEAVAFFNVLQPSLEHLRGIGGSIVAVTTAATRRYPVRDGLSSGTKGAVEAIVRAVAAEEGRFGIRANCVGPGMLTDGMAARLMASGDLDDAALEVTMRNIPLRRFGDAVDIAEAVCFLASDRADFISGQMLDIDGGYGV